jgi:hypothetical protein
MFGCYNLDMPTNPQVPDFSDRRDAPRADVDERYTMRLDPCNGREPITCWLLDYSVTGVRLELPKDAALQSEVQILIGKLSHNARIAWRKGTVIGVDFIDEHYSIY